MKYTRKKRKGGNAEIEHKLQSYVLQMKNKENINEDELKSFLDGIPNPLKRTILLEETQEKYTINEWSIIYESSIHTTFSNYDVSLYRRVKYPYHVFYSNEKFSILEAYVLQSIYLNNINAIFKQVEGIESNIDLSLFYFSNENDLFPSLLKYTFEVSNYKDVKTNIRSMNICFTIIQQYTVNDYAFNKLLSKTTLFDLFRYAVSYKQYNFIDFLLIKIAPNEYLEFVFHPKMIELLILNDDDQLYRTLIVPLNYYNSNMISEILDAYINNTEIKTKYIKDGKINPDKARSFFKKVAQHSIQNLEIREISHAPKIIIICHGISLGKHKINYSFPFNKLCFFVNEGNKLKDECIVGRQVEELICAGKYDLLLKCTDGVSGEIALEEMRFKFFAETYEHKRNGTLGFHYCFRKRVEKIDELVLDKDAYTMEELLEKCSLVCKKMFIQKEYVEILMFVCRGYIDAPEMSEYIKADVVVSPQSR